MTLSDETKAEFGITLPPPWSNQPLVLSFGPDSLETGRLPPNARYCYAYRAGTSLGKYASRVNQIEVRTLGTLEQCALGALWIRSKDHPEHDEQVLQAAPYPLRVMRTPLPFTMRTVLHSFERIEAEIWTVNKILDVDNGTGLAPAPIDLLLHGAVSTGSGA